METCVSMGGVGWTLDIVVLCWLWLCFQCGLETLWLFLFPQHSFLLNGLIKATYYCIPIKARKRDISFLFQKVFDIVSQ